ncbi:hypothetical protein REPUB_Repub09cG0130700 [Reevesia pubescens]
MRSLALIFFQYYIVSFSGLYFSSAADDTLTPIQSIKNGSTLVSTGQSFELGFFSSGESSNQYLGIWYKRFPNIVVWVANRENPVNDSHAILNISSTGNLVIFDGENKTVWSSNSSRAAKNPVAQLLDSGNFVVRDTDSEDTDSYLWESFELPSDTQLPGMKIGWNLKTGINRYLTSWKDLNDPSPGDFTYGIEKIGLPQVVLREGMKKRFRTGPWNGIRFSGFSSQLSTVFNHVFVDTTEELYVNSEVKDNSIITRLVVNESGLIQRLVLYGNSSEWTVMYALQNDLCDDYARCGPNGICRINKRPICECLTGFLPRLQHEWEVLNWTAGCVRTPLGCQKGEGFVKLANVKLPDLMEFKLNKSLNLKDCRAECLKNCSCIAYANSDISNGGTGCLMWFGNLIDIREFIEGQTEQDIYIRMPASELSDSSLKSKTMVITVATSTIFGLLAFLLACWYAIWKYRRKKRGSKTDKEDLELPLFDFVTIASATNNFSDSNKIGKGGFGLVYKGELFKGLDIAVKRLSSNSHQGVEQFKNEVVMIAKLQHRNLVRLLGCCIERDERMLIYEFMPNKSLDCFIFGSFI